MPSDEQLKKARSRAVDSAKVDEVFTAVFTAVHAGIRQASERFVTEGGLVRAIPFGMLMGGEPDATFGAFETLTAGLFEAAAKYAEFQIEWDEVEKFDAID